MSSSIIRSLFSNLTLYRPNSLVTRPIHTGTVYYAARKGTRAKARAKKVKVEITKVGFIPHNQRGKDKSASKLINRHLDDSYKQIASDDVYPLRYFRWPVYTAEEAVRAHQETHHPTMYNNLEAYVYANIELDMQGIKKTRYLENFSKLSLLPNFFPREEERTILAFCKGQDLIKQVQEAGATTVGSTELVKKIQEGSIKLGDYDYVIAHPNIITDLVPIRGLMKRRFPNVKSGTLDLNITLLVKKFAAGVHYRIVKDENQQNFGSVQVPVGRLNMDAKCVAENIATVLKDIQASRPKREGLFITRCIIVSPPSSERFKIDPFVYVERTLNEVVEAESDDENESIAVTA